MSLAFLSFVFVTARLDFWILGALSPFLYFYILYFGKSQLLDLATFAKGNFQSRLSASSKSETNLWIWVEA